MAAKKKAAKAGAGAYAAGKAVRSNEYVQRLMEDAKTTGRWYLGVTMGRPTGHLTLGIGKAASATCTIIPEEFRRDRVSLADICDVVEGSIIKHRDAQGNIRVAEIDLGRKVKSEVQARLERRGIKVTLVDKTIGYELRCAPPIPYDAEYARDLGYAAFRHLHGGGSGTMIMIQGGEFRPVPFSQLVESETGRGRERPVDVDTESYQVARDYMVRINEKDFADDAWVAKLAEAGGLSAEEFVARFGSQP